jgi:hypothetical protein
MQQIETIDNAIQEFSECLRAVMSKKQIFDPQTHGYLTNLMTQYVHWQDDELRPSIHAQDTRPFVLQLNSIADNKEYLKNSALWCERLKSIAETLLMAVGYWPESIAQTPVRERPGIKYYVKLGRTAYSQASDIMQAKRFFGKQAMLMKEMSEGFNDYAAVLYHFRHDIGDIPVDDVRLIFELSRLMRDESIEKRLLLSVQEKENSLIQ